MLPDGSLREGLLLLREQAAAILPVRAVGIARRERDHVVLTHCSVFGVIAHRVLASEVPEAVRPPARGLQELGRADCEANPGGLIETQMLLSGMPPEIREHFGVGRLFTLPLPGAEAPMLLTIGAADSGPLTPGQAAGLESLAKRAKDELFRQESPEAELERLRRLRAAEGLLPALFRVLDIREVFARVSELTREAMPHDILALAIFSRELTEVTFYAHTAPGGRPWTAPIAYSRVLTRAWLYDFVDDLAASPVERDRELTRAGGRSSLRIAIRLGDSLFGGLNFTSFATARYTSADLAVARGIADYVALALSHQQLAEEVRRSEELRARAANSDLLDELLASLTDTGELKEVFERISAIAKKVLPHDALVLPVLLPDGRHVRVYAFAGFSFPDIADVAEVPDAILAQRDRDYIIVDDSQAEPGERDIPPAKLGYRSILRVPIRLDGKIAGALEFLSFAPSSYKHSDAAVARRIADRVALALSRERREQALVRADEASARAERLESRVQALTEELNARAGFRRVIGDSATWRQALTQATQVAPTESTVLLLGESGTGKEVVARFVHGGSRRSDGPFVALNCAALPEQLLESELFGYERGAFTGATQSKPGQLEQASGGTLFLDEVGEMSLSAQAKFLRVLQEREFQRLGGTRVLKTDARVVAATNRDLTKAMERGQFREDLYYRLNVFSIQLPPLRERRDDVLPLSEAFIGELGKMLGRPPAGISKQARQALMEYHWPGNVRELRNVLERAAILADGGLIAAEHLALRPAVGQATAPSSAEPPAAPVEDLKSAEKAMIEKALRDAQLNKSEAAKRLGITRAQLYVRLRRYGLE